MTELFNVTNATLDNPARHLQNPACADEIRAFEEICTNFKADVVSKLGTNLKYMLIAIAILTLARIYIQYSNNPRFKTEMWNKVLFKIDFVTMMLIVIAVGYIFI